MGLTGEDGARIRHVGRCVKSLTDGGYLLPRRRKQSSTVYQLALERTPLSFQEEETVNDPDSDLLSDAEPRKDVSVLSSDLEKTPASPSKDTGVPIKGHQCPTELLNELLNEPEGGRRARAKRLPSDFGLDRETQEWAESKLGSSEAVYHSMFRFTNHYRQAAGSRGLSTDWMAKARLWIDDDAAKQSSGKTVVGASTAPSLTHDQWDRLLASYVKTGRWTRHVDQCGSEPPSPDCRAPRHLLIKHGILKESAA
jgi:hypothetical protein